MSEIKSFEFTDRKGRKILIRNAKPEDAEQINSMKRKIIAEGMYMLREPDEANYTTEKTIEEISVNTSNPGSMYIIAESDGKVAGELDFVNGSLKEHSIADHLSFHFKEYRDSGIGLKLMDAAEWAEEEPS
ncbi:MAG: GNAT family N-acetyltransferase [Ignavibacteria bacterium]|nr:GNAT family N-acetyltransferase [Ignavibacteria bacterium]